jgi:DNA topoisomerase-1
LERKYVEIKEKKFYPTDLGHAVNKFLVANFDKLFNVTFTADMETKLDNIEYGKQEWRILLNDYYNAIKDLLAKVNISESKKEMTQATDILCEKCNSPMVIKMSKRGQFLACSNYPACKNAKSFHKDENGNITIVDNTPQETGIKCEKCNHEMVIKRTKKGIEFLACSNYPKCKNAKNIKKDSEGKIEIAEPQTTNEKCPKCGKDMVVRHGRYGEFLSCSGYPKCKSIKSINKTTNIKCPSCGSGEITVRKGKRGAFYSCTNYPDCKYISNYKPVEAKCSDCGHYFLEEHISKGGDTTLVCPKCKREYR